MKSLRHRFIVVMCIVAISNIIVMMAIYLAVINYAIVNYYIPQSVELYTPYVDQHFQRGGSVTNMAETLDQAHRMFGSSAFLPPPITDDQGNYLYPPNLVGKSFELTTRPIKMAHQIANGGPLLYFIPYTHVSDYPMLIRHLGLGLTSIAVALLLACFSAVVIATVFARHIITPILALAHASRQPQLNASFRSQISEHTVTEIIVLADALDDMRNEIHHHISLRQALNADIAHELRNPLNTLVGTIEAIHDGVFEPTPQRMKTIYSEASVIQRLVEDMRIMSLADLDNLPLQLQPVPADEFFHQLCSIIAPVSHQHQVQFIAPTAVPNVFVLIDNDRMLQVFGNIIDNALRHTPPDGTIRITTALDQHTSHLVITVIDTGSGIDEADIPFLFERFYRGSNPNGPGSGLGLPIARSIVTAHHGTISVSSQIHVGTEIHISLPIL